MANSVDFRADQIQTKQIIVTGSGAGTTKLLIYGIEAQGSPVNEGLINQTVFPSNTTIGSDVFLYVSGALNAKGSATERGTSVFGGDLVVSGSLYNGLVTATGGNYSHAEGYATLASSLYSHAEGYGTLASQIHSHAEGYLTTGSGEASHAEGYGTLAEGNYSHAEGSFTKTTGLYSHAEGINNTAQGDYSHAEGSDSIALGYYSHAGGIFTIASGSGQTVFGSYNKRLNTNSFFAIGNGTGDSDELRGDIFRAESTGELVMSGAIRHAIKVVNSFATPTTNMTRSDYLVLVQTTVNAIVVLPEITDVVTDLGLTVEIRQMDSALSARKVIIQPHTNNSAYLICGFDAESPTLVLGAAPAGTNTNRSVTLTFMGLGTSPKNKWVVIATSTC